MRQLGMTYDEILTRVPIARSTLSIWLRSVGLARKQEQLVTQEREAARVKAVKAVESKKREKVARIQEESREQAGHLIGDPFWMLGLALFWGEGDKPKPWRENQDLRFSNMDPHMVRIFIKWTTEYFNLKGSDFIYELYVHQSSAHRIDDCLNYWSEHLGVEKENFKIRYKKSPSKTNRRNIDATYYGLVRVKVRRSTDMVRRISGWLDVVVHSF